MNLTKYLSMPNCTVPQDISDHIASGDNVTAVEFDNKDNIVLDTTHHYQCGCTRMSDGSYYVAMYTPMPNVTVEMVQWWFWWHVSSSDRYQAWYPGEHFRASYNKKNKNYFQSKTVPPFQPNTQYPVERIGKLSAPLTINFVTPQQFGFGQQAISSSATIVCGHVGAFRGLIPNTEMSHIFVPAEQGLLAISRFWLGKNVKSKLLRKLLVTDKQAHDMAVHCCIEYRNFDERIPHMYNSWLAEVSTNK